MFLENNFGLDIWDENRIVSIYKELNTENSNTDAIKIKNI